MPNPPPQPPLDRFCDLVMKGGITSGVVYPKAIARLAQHYRFKNIGGTSAGAIAAAVTAAAEYNRRNGSNDGFTLLESLPEALMAKVDAQRSKLLSLFQPDPRAKRLFSVLLHALNSQGTYRRVAAILVGLLLAYWIATISAVIAGVVVFQAAGIVAGALATVLALPITIGISVYRDVTRNLVKDDFGFGMCTGMTAPGSSVPALTPWLHEQIQRAAGLSLKGQPLTFGMLWQAPGLPPAWKEADPKMRSIDLQMFSTNLAHGRPYVFPLPESAPNETQFPARDRLFFKEAELRRYLPEDVLKLLVDHGTPYRLAPERKGHDPSDDAEPATDLIELPPPAKFPVLLAARMSLSFPFLFCAVPLWAIDYDPPPEKRVFRRCWFSDGGISSNFPMHLFDGLLPSWPTFGINLEPKVPGREAAADMVYLPTAYRSGYGERWDRFDCKQEYASRFGGFLVAIVNAMQNWNDNTLGRMPGIRDRVARVRLNDGEGGMNLNMEGSTIDAITNRGLRAADALIHRYVAATPNGPQSKGWDEQRWVRLGVLLKMIEERSPGVRRATSANCAQATSYEVLIANAGQPGQAPAGYVQSLSPAQQQAISDLLDALGRLASTDIPTDFVPIPRPELRVRPPL